VKFLFAFHQARKKFVTNHRYGCCVNLCGRPARMPGHQLGGHQSDKWTIIRSTAAVSPQVSAETIEFHQTMWIVD